MTENCYLEILKKSSEQCGIAQDRNSIVLDDFGTAQINLSYLRGFPSTLSKIDRGFLRALNSDRQARSFG